VNHYQFGGVAFFFLFSLPELGALIPLQLRSEHAEPLPSILLAYAGDEMVGAGTERARIAKTIAANRPNESHFIPHVLRCLRLAGQNGADQASYPRAMINWKRPDAGSMTRSRWGSRLPADWHRLVAGTDAKMKAPTVA
jgi:hypothetical protein